MPEPLDVLDGRGTSLALISAFALAVTIGTLNDAIEQVEFHVTHDHTLLQGLMDGILQPAMLGPAAVWALVALQMQLPLAAVRAARKRGFLPKEIRFAAFRQPQNWRFFWYPPRFRRHDDVWCRLPAPFRRVRGFATLALVALFLGFLSSVVAVFGQQLGNLPASRVSVRRSRREVLPDFSRS